MERKISAFLVVLAAFSASPLRAEEPAPAQSDKKPEVKVTVSGVSAGVETAGKPTTYNGPSEPSSSATTVTGGVSTQGVSTFGGRKGVLEWDATGKLKLGAGNPADQNTGVTLSPAYGFELTGKGDIGYMPLNKPCSPYLSGGVGTELKATVMNSVKGHLDAPAVSTPDAQADIYIRAGAGLACISDKLVLIVTPYVALRADTLASGGGSEVGLRGTVILPDNFAISMEAATMSATGGKTNKSTETRAAVSVKKFIGQRWWVGASATVADVDLKHAPVVAGTDVTYEKTYVPFVVGIDAGFRFK